jgi:hypothetical protein
MERPPQVRARRINPYTRPYSKNAKIRKFLFLKILVSKVLN